MLGTSMVIGDGVLTPSISGMLYHFIILLLVFILLFTNHNFSTVPKILLVLVFDVFSIVLSAVGGLKEATSHMTEGLSIYLYCFDLKWYSN